MLVIDTKDSAKYPNKLALNVKHIQIVILDFIVKMVFVPMHALLIVNANFIMIIPSVVEIFAYLVRLMPNVPTLHIMVEQEYAIMVLLIIVVFAHRIQIVTYQHFQSALIIDIVINVS